MDNVKIVADKSELVAIADAVRSKTGNSNSMSLSEIAAGIENLKSIEEEVKVIVENQLMVLDNKLITTVKDYAFTQSSLHTINLPAAKYIGNSAFSQNFALSEINLPSVKTLGEEAFSACFSLTKIKFQNLEGIGYYALSSNTSLQSVDLTYYNDDFYIDEGAFYNCYQLQQLILRGPFVQSILYDFLNYEYRESIYIYVPKNLINQYINNNEDYNFRALEDYTIDGTIYGELDKNKTNFVQKEKVWVSFPDDPYALEMVTPSDITWFEFINSEYNIYEFNINENNKIMGLFDYQTNEPVDETDLVYKNRFTHYLFSDL